MATHNHAPRRGQCTHITMHRLHGNYICQMCGKFPEHGWLYVCRQDWLTSHQDSVATNGESSIVVPDESDYFDVMSRYAASLRMSPSVTEQIRIGQYTYDQVEKLVAQREHLISTIKQIENLSINTESTPASRQPDTFPSFSASDIVASVGITANPPASDQKQPDVAQNSSSLQQTSTGYVSASGAMKKQPPMKTETCNYMVCHTCRPFLQDRLYINIGSVLDGSQPPITEAEVMTLPMMQPRIVRNFGLRQPAPDARLSPIRLQRSQSIDISLIQRGDSNNEFDTPLDWTTCSTSSSSYEDDLGELRAPDPFPCPGAGVCPVYSRNSGCAYDTQDFDDGQRALAHGFTADAMPTSEHTTPHRPLLRLHRVGRSISGSPGRSSSSASSISLPTPTTIPLTPGASTNLAFEDELVSKFPKQKPGRAATICGVLSPSMDFSNARLSVGSALTGKDSDDSFGSEIEVEGGVALTEEAVGSGLPDIRTE